MATVNQYKVGQDVYYVNRWYPIEGFTLAGEPYFYATFGHKAETWKRTIREFAGKDYAYWEGSPEPRQALIWKVRERAIPTDKELADKYRALRKEASDIAKELQGRGFEVFVLLEDARGFRRIPKTATELKFKFKKTVTEVIEI